MQFGFPPAAKYLILIYSCRISLVTVVNRFKVRLRGSQKNEARIF